MIPSSIMSQCTIVLISVLLWIHKGCALSCYQCDSSVDRDCKEDFDWAHLDTLTVQPTECTVDSAVYCVKTTGVWGGVVGTTRFCSSRNMFNQCQYVSYWDHNRVYRACIYTCKGDNCNAATTSATVSMATTMSLAAATTVVILLFGRRT